MESEESMKLHELLHGIPGLSALPPHDPEMLGLNILGLNILGLSSHSGTIQPGDLFLARRGTTYDATADLEKVAALGAAAAVTERVNPSLLCLPQVLCESVGVLEPILADRFYRSPSLKMRLFGVTGTNGKTSTSYFIKGLHDALEKRCGLIGTVETIVGDQRYPSTHTTPPIIELQRLLHAMVRQQCSAVAMEVSSHALVQGRIQGVSFDVAVFTNLTQDHLDYHGTMEKYCAAKRELFLALQTDERKQERWAVINQDDPWHRAILEGYSGPFLSYGRGSHAQLKIDRLMPAPQGTQVTLSYGGLSRSVSSQLIGEFNVYNLCAAIGAMLTSGYDFEQLMQAVETLKPVQGRMQRVSNALGAHIYVDYAHTEDALTKVLSALRATVGEAGGDLWVVFGCGGNRDPGKRGGMGRVCEALADHVIVTNDNPRDEDAQSIADQVMAGFQNPSRHQQILDREEAICDAIQRMQPHDLLLIAGKGHETTQIIQGKTLPFDDRVVAYKICETLSQRGKP